MTIRIVDSLIQMKEKKEATDNREPLIFKMHDYRMQPNPLIWTGSVHSYCLTSGVITTEL